MTYEERVTLEKLLVAYHAGINNVKHYKGIPPFKETQDFVKSIMDKLTRSIDNG